jgi:3-deoxy-D-manno-octulosonic-acid transferase
MMEPAALGKPVVVGPAVEDFQETVDALIEGEGIIQTDRSSLRDVIERLLRHPEERHQLATNARAVIRQQQGASQRNREIVMSMLRSRGSQRTTEG